MFYSETILTNKHSPIGIAWLLATLGPKNQARKISRKELIAFDLVNACEYIAEPPEPLALRTSATLLYGVANVYNQHFDEFYTNVNTFHHILRRSIITDFSTSGGTGTGGTRGIDLSDEGKSKIDQITFGGIDLGWQSGLDFNFGLIDWADPLGPARKRRASSKLDSQQSQQSENQDDEEDDEDALEDEEGIMRKRARSNSTAGFGDPTRRKNSIHHRSDRITPLQDDFIPPIDLGLDFGQGPDTSFSAPGDDFNAGPGDGDFNFDNFDNGVNDYNYDNMTPQPEQQPDIDTDGNPKPPSPLKSAQKKRRRSSEESTDQEEEEEAEKEEPKKRIKKQKKVKWDQSLEMEDEAEGIARQKYAEAMEIQRREMLAKEEEKAAAGIADRMVDSAGGWLEFFNPEMKAMFSTISKVGKFKWELDLAAHRLGKQYVPEEEEQIEPREVVEADQQDYQGYQDDYDPNQGGPDGPDYNDYNNDYQDVFHETMQEIDPNSKPRRSQSTDVEIGRRASQSSQVPLPWHIPSRADEDNGFYDPPSDGGFTPGSLHLSAMTPQEARLRLYSRSKSGTGAKATGTGGPAGRHARSRSGSVLQDRANGPAAMLYNGPEDESQPAQEVIDLAEEPSQFLSADVPDAFKPESLATIETQCRNFLSYVEKKMISNKTDEVDFDDVVDYKTPRRVAATAFYNCLTLTTKHLIKVDQAEAWDSFTIRFIT